MQKVFVTPKEGVLVRREDGKPLDAAGEAVERSSYWLRRERDGDVTLKPMPKTEAASGATAVADLVPTKKASKA